MIKSVIFILILVRAMNAFSCSFSSPSVINIGVSLENEKYFSYGQKAVNESIPYAEIKNCSMTAAKGKYVMVTYGPELVDTIDSSRGINFNKEYREQLSCTFLNNPLTHLTTSDERKRNFDNKWKLINKCIQITVKEIGSRPLSFPKMQEGCSITSNSSSSATFTGGYCFFKPSPDSNYNIMVSVSKECLTLKGFNESDIDLQDINTELSAYTSLTYKDELEDLVTLGTSSVRFSINPDKSILKPSEDFGILRPTFPAQYQVNDLHIGKILFTELSNNKININVPLIVDNAKCTPVKINGVQASACDYATPYVGSITLKDDHGKEVFTWQDGGIASANWQGILSGEGFQLTKEMLPANKLYTMIIEFGDPTFSFSSFRNRVIQKIGHLNSGFPIFSRDGSISEITGINQIEEIDNMITIDPINGLNFENPILNLANSRRRLSSYFSTSMFPPAYEKTCNSSGQCLDASKIFAKFIVSFNLKSDYTVGNLIINRSSELLGSYKKIITQQPEYICE